MNEFTDDKFMAILRNQRQLRVMGIDDTPFNKRSGEPVSVAGVICSNTRFEGMIWAHVTEDGDDATDVLLKHIHQSKFYEQLHLVIIDGIALAGFNVIHLKKLSEALQLPCVAVMRKAPDLPKMKKALEHVSNTQQKIERLSYAGPIYRWNNFYYQVHGLEPGITAKVLERLTDTGHVPEALRIAHFIGAAVKLGESSRRA